MSLPLLTTMAPPVPAGSASPFVQTGPTFTKTLGHVREQVQEDDQHKWDATVPCRQICLHGGRLVFPHAQDTGFEQGLSLTPWAMNQACQKLGIPAGYFRKCPPALQDQQFNYWNQSDEVGRQFAKADTDPDQAWLLRAKGSTLRGVLSSRYARLDNAALLDTLLPILSGTRYQVGLVALSSESFHLRLVDPTIARDVLPGDRLLVGVHIANSEVGLRAVTVDAIVYRLVCSNGLVRRVNSKSLLRQRHLHVSEPRFADLLAQAVQEAVTVAAGFIEQIAGAIRTPVPDPERAITLLGQSWSLSQTTQEQVRFALLAEKPQGTLYALSNALTLVAQRLNPDERFHLETLTGALVDTASSSAADSHLRGRVLAPVRRHEPPAADTYTGTTSGANGSNGSGTIPNPDRTLGLLAV